MAKLTDSKNGINFCALMQLKTRNLANKNLKTRNGIRVARYER